MTKTFETKVINNMTVDTRNFRYIADYTNTGVIIKRKALIELDTDTAWEVVKVIK